jgi:hypothetical protein
MTTNETAKPVMLRADITSDEWKALRILALELGTTTQALVARALRATFTLTTKGQVTR